MHPYTIGVTRYVIQSRVVGGALPDYPSLRFGEIRCRPRFFANPPVEGTSHTHRTGRPGSAVGCWRGLTCRRLPMHACFESRRWSRRDVEDRNIWLRSMGVHVEFDCDRFVSTWDRCRCTCCVKRSYACSATELSEFQCPGRAGHRAAAGRETILPGSRCRGDPRSPKGSRSESSRRPNPS